MDNIILLDLDGVLITTKPWESDHLLEDGFAEFNKKSVDKLNEILDETGYDIVLTSARRYSVDIDKMNEFFKTRGIKGQIIGYNRLFDLDLKWDRAKQIMAFLMLHRPDNYLIIDDDKSIGRMNSSLCEKWIKTDPMIGLK